MRVQETWGCPRCGRTETRVKGTRRQPSHIRRQRECLRCGQRFLTIEVIVDRDPREQAETNAALAAFGNMLADAVREAANKILDSLGGRLG